MFLRLLDSHAAAISLNAPMRRSVFIQTSFMHVRATTKRTLMQEKSSMEKIGILTEWRGNTNGSFQDSDTKNQRW